MREEATTNQGSRAGEQHPVRLEVGEPQGKGRAENCSFSGTVVELHPTQLKAAGVEKLLCPECGAARKATVRGELVSFPPHTPLRIPRAQKGSCGSGKGQVGQCALEERYLLGHQITRGKTSGNLVTQIGQAREMRNDFNRFFW